MQQLDTLFFWINYCCSQPLGFTGINDSIPQPWGKGSWSYRSIKSPFKGGVKCECLPWSFSSRLLTPGRYRDQSWSVVCKQLMSASGAYSVFSPGGHFCCLTSAHRSCFSGMSYTNHSHSFQVSSAFWGVSAEILRGTMLNACGRCWFLLSCDTLLVLSYGHMMTPEWVVSAEEGCRVVRIGV